MVNLKQARWRCRNLTCARLTFVEPLPHVAPRYARRTSRVIELAVLLAHTAGGRPAERLMTRLGLPQSDDTLLRALKRRVADRQDIAPVQVVGVDDWSWRKGSSYGTIMVDLQRREVVDVLTDRSAETTARWLVSHPEVEIISRDRCGLYAQGAMQGAPQARQVADRFHLLQNLRQSIERQLSRAPRPPLPVSPSEGSLAPPDTVIRRYGQPEVTEDRHLVRTGRRAVLHRKFAQVKALQREGKSHGAIVRETGLHWRTIDKWARLDALPERAIMAPRTTTPNGFRTYLAQRWAAGCTMGRELLAEIRTLGYTGSLTHLQRLLNRWRRAHFAAEAGAPALQNAVIVENSMAPVVSPIVAAMLCIKPRGMLTQQQEAQVDKLKAEHIEFATMRKLAMRLRGIMRAGDAKSLDGWLHDALEYRIHGMRQFAITLRQDIAAVRNAICEPWSNGQTEGQINRLKTLKRAMYGRAGIDLLRARMLPLHSANANRH